MRCLVVADVHANLEAFQAVLADAQRGGGIDAIWCLGDIVGYGPDPESCLELLQGYPHEAVAGNHDLAAVGVIGVEDFNPYAAAAARWTATKLSAVAKVWLMSLPQVSVLDYGFTLVHGSLVDPVWEYLVYPDNAAQHFERQTTRYSLVGHTHLPRVFYDVEFQPVANAVNDETTLPLEEIRFVANPGSVGQPRDGDPRAAYAVLDSDVHMLSFHRVEYDVEKTQEKMRKAGLPVFLIDRLSKGR